MPITVKFVGGGAGNPAIFMYYVLLPFSCIRVLLLNSKALFFQFETIKNVKTWPAHT